jgi:chaperone required for assembly of F1-ATPase
MRDIFEELFREQGDPVEAARRNMRPALRKRFYNAAGVENDGAAFRLVLDGKPVRTPARRVLAAPSEPLARAIAAEWQAQDNDIDPARMPLTRLANTIIDGVAAFPDPVREEIAKYLASDLLFYRAEGPQGLLARQAQHWDPVLAWAREAFGARFVLSQGVVFVTQPAAALAAMRPAIPAQPWRLGAVHSLTTLTGSALLALALSAGRLAAGHAWAAANVDEDWNMEQWGEDARAHARRAARFAELRAAALVLELV